MSLNRNILKMQKQVITEGTKASWFFSFTFLGLVFFQLTLQYMSCNASLMLWCENYWASLEMFVLIHRSYRLSETPVNPGQVGETFRWKGLARTLKPVQIPHLLPTLVSHHQATPSSTTPASSDQGPPLWLCPKSMAESISSHGFCLGLG